MSDDLPYTCPHCWQEHKAFAGMPFGEILALRHNHEHLRMKAELLQLKNNALQEENARLRAALKPFADAAIREGGKDD